MEEAVSRNIEACMELALQTRSSYGPNGFYFLNILLVGINVQLFFMVFSPFLF